MGDLIVGRFPLSPDGARSLHPSACPAPRSMSDVVAEATDRVIERDPMPPEVADRIAARLATAGLLSRVGDGFWLSPVGWQSVQVLLSLLAEDRAVLAAEGLDVACGSPEAWTLVQEWVALRREVDQMSLEVSP